MNLFYVRLFFFWRGLGSIKGKTIITPCRCYYYIWKQQTRVGGLTGNLERRVTKRSTETNLVQQRNLCINKNEDGGKIFVTLIGFERNQGDKVLA